MVWDGLVCRQVPVWFQALVWWFSGHTGDEGDATLCNRTLEMPQMEAG